MILKEDWEYNTLGIYNYKRPGKLKNYIDFIIENQVYLEGDILEAGVFRGKTLLGIALLLKEINSNKKIYGFDSFSGFPPIYSEYDDIKKFFDLMNQGRISKEHYEKIEKNLTFKSFEIKGELGAKNLSASGDFSNTNIQSLQKKIELLELDNIILVPGNFDESMKSDQFPEMKLMAAILDCDLYMSYKVSLPFIWEKLVNGGYIYLDEYYSLKFPGARIACDEFFNNKFNKPQKHVQELGDFERWFVRKILKD